MILKRKKLYRFYGLEFTRVYGCSNCIPCKYWGVRGTRGCAYVLCRDKFLMNLCLNLPGIRAEDIKNLENYTYIIKENKKEI